MFDPLRFAFAAIFVTAMVTLGMVMIVTVIIPGEEENLVKIFGAEYEAYRKRTGRLFPRW